MVDVSWLDRAAYPFTSRYLQVDGGRMHYIDEGRGPTLLFVHGTPVWSFVYRHLIRDLARDFRCVALDHIGFGLSDKPPAWGYSVEAHARNLAALVDHLGLGRLTLVAHDLGGPIGLRWASEHAEQVERLALFNTLMWPMEGPFAVPPVGRLFAGPVGSLLYLRLNASARGLIPLVFGDRSKLTKAIHRQYIAPFPRPADRHGMYAFAREVGGGLRSNAELFERRGRLAAAPLQLIWGLKDPAFGPAYLARWRELRPDARVLECADAGHFVMEEQPAAAIAALRAFLA